MKKILNFAAFLFILNGLAQNSEQVVNNYIKALGGKDKLAAVKAVQKKDILTSNGMDFPMDTYQDITGKIYSEMEMGGQKIILVAFDGKKGFMFDNRSFGYKDIPEDKKNDFINKAKNMFGYFYNYKKAGHSLKYIGQKEKDGQKVDALEMHLKEPVEGGIQDLTAYFDADSHLLKTIEIKKDGNVIVTKINNYKKFDNSDILFPVEIVTEMNGNPVMTLKTQEIEINPTAPSSEKFVKPNN